MRPTIIVCTRDRPEAMARCLASIGVARAPECRLIVVDQSTDDTTASVVLRSRMENVVYVRSRSRGLSAARNEGVRQAEGEDLLLFTDDDCEVAPKWVERWREAFEANPTLGVGFGWVQALPFDRLRGHIPHFDPGPRSRVTGVEAFRKGAHTVGMGANMVVLRRAWAVAGGFDESLGAGARFRAAEDLDLAYRIVTSGYLMMQSRGSPVLHRGHRATEDASRLGRGYALGSGAMYRKLTRCGDRQARTLLARELGHLASTVLSNAARGRRPTGFNSLRSFVDGFVSSGVHPVDTRWRTYQRAQAAGVDSIDAVRSEFRLGSDNSRS